MGEAERNMKKKIIGIIICTLLIGTIILPTSVKTSETGIDTQKQNNISSDYSSISTNAMVSNHSIDDFIINTMTDNHLPGLSATIVRNDTVVWTKSYGYANLSQNLTVKNTTLFFLASVSKTIVATALMQLYEQDYFELNDSINDYLPFNVIHPTFPSTDITFHMLLTHTSSIQDNWAVMPLLVGDPTIPLGDYLEDYLTPGGAYYDPTLNFYPQQPGHIWGYSNIGIALLGYLVENMYGESFPEYCETHIFEPLDMPETAWFLADLNISNIAVPYAWGGGHYVAYPQYGNSFYPRDLFAAVSPSFVVSFS